MSTRTSRFDRLPAAVAIGIVLVFGLLQAVAAVLPRHPTIDFLFAFESYRGTSALYPVIAAAVAAGVLVAGGRAGVGMLRPRGDGWRFPAFSILVAASAVLFFVAPSWTVSGDAGLVLERVARGEVYPSNALTSLLHVGVMRVLPVSALDAIRLVSWTAGVVSAFLVVPLVHRLRAGRADRIELTAVIWILCSGSFSLFYGTIEVYAPLQAAVLAYVVLGLGSLRDGRSVLWPGMALGIAFSLHGSAGLLLPSLAALAVLAPGRRPRQLLGAVSGFAVPWLLTVAILYLFVWGGSAPPVGPELYGSFLGGMGHGPILDWVRTTENILHRYVLLDVDHAVSVLNVLALACPAFALLAFGHWRALLRVLRLDRISLWLAVGAVPLVAFPVVWNVSYHLRQDWDLFMIAGVPCACLAVRLFMLRRDRLALLTGALVGLMMFAPIVHHRHVDRLAVQTFRNVVSGALAGSSGEADAGEAGNDGERDDGERDDAERDASAQRNRAAAARIRARLMDGPYGRALSRLDRAMADMRASRHAQAETELRAALEANPGEPYLLLQLGLAMAQQGTARADEAADHLWQSIRDGRAMVGPWLVLAQMADLAGDTRRAVRLLETGIPRGSLDPSMPVALMTLGDLRRKAGDTAGAAAVERLIARLRKP